MGNVMTIPDVGISKRFFIDFANRNMHGDRTLVIGRQQALFWEKEKWVTVLFDFTYGFTSKVELTDLGESILDFEKL